MKKITVLFCFVIIVFSICFFSNIIYAASKIMVTSQDFNNKGSISNENACDVLGEDKSPQFSFSNVSPDTQNFALIMFDPDYRNFVHWIIYNIPNDKPDLQQGLPRDGELEGGIRQGINSTGEIGYFGPCPPPKETHRYVFQVFALDTNLNLEAGANSKQLKKAMKGHIVGRGKLVGYYKNETNL